MHVRMYALCKGFKKLDKGIETENTLTGSVIFMTNLEYIYF